MILDELALKAVDVDGEFGTRLRRVPMSMSSSCWGKSGGEGGVRYRAMGIEPRPLEQKQGEWGRVQVPPAQLHVVN